jgi:hypothetical protein
MKLFVFLSLVCASLVSCADKEPPKPVGPQTSSTRIPWNAPQKGQGGGQFGMLPQNQYRR